MKYRVSYAQNREDFLIAAFFPDVTEGHYVDIGASDPTQYSVTRLFYEMGWSGINVEPIPELAERLRTERPRDVTVQAGLGAMSGSAAFRQYVGSGLSTTSPEMMDRHAAQDSPETSEFTDDEIQIVTLAAVLEQHPLSHIHFLKIDVEGSEFDVLSGNRWQQFRPELICIETEHMVRDWMPLLNEVGYEQVFHDGLNAYLLAAEARARVEHFRYPQAVLSAPVIVTPEVGAQLSHVTELWEQTEHLTQLNQQLVAESEQRAGVNSQLSDQLQSLSHQVKELSVQVQQLTDDIEVRDAALAAERSVSALYATRETETAARLQSTELFLAEVLSSQSWRYTYPVRRLSEILKARIPRRVLRRVWHRIRPAIEAARTTAALEETELSPDGVTVLERLRAQSEA
jgi:FkbM family methyltransferase